MNGTPTTWRLSVSDHIEEVDEVEWDRISAHLPVYASYGWLRATEWHPALRSRYVLLRDGADADLLGGLPFYETDGVRNPNYSAATHGLIGESAREAAFPGLLLGSKGGYWTELPVAPGLTDSERSRVVHALLDRGLSLTAEGGYGSASLMYLSTAAAVEVVATNLFFRGPYLIGAAARLPITFSTFDAYLQSLDSRRRRQFRQEIASFEGGAYEITRSDLASEWRRLPRLLQQVQQRYGQPAELERLASLIENQARYTNSMSRVFLLERGHDLVGFVLLYEWNQALYGRILGFDYEKLAGASEYFNLALYTPIRYAVEHGLKLLDFGLESLAAKVKRGAVLVPLWAVISAPGSELPEPAEWNRTWLTRFLASNGGRGFDPELWSWPPFASVPLHHPEAVSE